MFNFLTLKSVEISVQVVALSFSCCFFLGNYLVFDNLKYSISWFCSKIRFADKQIVRLQETPNEIPEGGTPHTVSLLMHDKLVDAGKPGDRVEVRSYIFTLYFLKVYQLQLFFCCILIEGASFTLRLLEFTGLWVSELGKHRGLWSQYSRRAPITPWIPFRFSSEVSELWSCGLVTPIWK